MQTWIRTRSGKKFDFANITEDSIDINDMALGLARTCRFAGQGLFYYPVSRHSINLAWYVMQVHGDAKLAYGMLFHDGAEYVCGDAVGPLKQFCPDYKKIETEVKNAIARKFGADLSDPRIKAYDLRIQTNEKNILFADAPFKCEVEYEPLEIELQYPPTPIYDEDHEVLLFMNYFRRLRDKL